jgi:hypothetical protein
MFRHTSTTAHAAVAGGRHARLGSHRHTVCTDNAAPTSSYSFSQQTDALIKPTLQWLMDALHIQCSTHAHKGSASVVSSLVERQSLLPVLDTAFTDTDLADTIPYMHPPSELISDYLNHYVAQ